MANKAFKTKFGLSVGDEMATISGASGNIFTNGNLQVNGSTTLGNDYITDTITVNGGVAGNIEFTDNSTTTIRGTKGTVGTNDYWHIGGAATGSDQGYAVIATGDNGTEPIYVQQYTSGTATSTLTLLDGSGNTVLPGDLTVTGNDIKSSTGYAALTFNDINVKVNGELTITGNTIRSSGGSAFPAGTVALTLSGATVSAQGDLFVENNGNAYISGQSLVLNNNDTAGADVGIYSYRGAGGVSSTSIRWNETTDRWQTTTDASTFLNIPNQNLDTTDSPAFAGATLGAVTVGVDTDQTISTTSGNLVLQTAAGVNSGTITIFSGSTGNITLEPSTTGDIHLNTDNVRIGDANATATLSTFGTGNLVLTTNEGSGVEGTLTLANGANGAITLDPNGTGNVVCTFSDGGNITNNRNYVFGAIRNATTQTTNGDIWELNTSAAQSATNPYFRGVSIDNSADTTRGPATLLRSYAGATGGGSASRGRVIFEKARGTAASPSAIQSGDLLGSIDVTGYTSTGWINDTIPAVTGFFGFTASENYVSNTALGTNFSLSLAPTATPISTGANLIQVMNLNPQAAVYRSDEYTFQQGKTGTTQYLNISATRANFGVPVQFPSYTAAAANAITGAVGRQIAITDSPTVGGRMAFWDTTNARWSYISDNSAV
jgi:hypothetical protein